MAALMLHAPLLSGFHGSEASIVFQRAVHHGQYLFFNLIYCVVTCSPLPPVPREPVPDLTVTDLPVNVTVWAAPQDNGPIRYPIIHYDIYRMQIVSVLSFI